MLRLDLATGPRWLTLEPGVEVQLAPMHHGIWLAAMASDAAVAADAARDAQAWTYVVGIEVAQKAIIDWRGIGDMDGTPLPVTPEAVAALMRRRAAFDTFYDAYLGPWMGVVEEKKDFAPSPDGTSETAPATTAADATGSAPPAPAA
jgi:hypothetical protein